jgi:hypothetical protein
MPKSSRQASVTPPAAYQGKPGCIGRTSADLEAAVVYTVSVDVCAAPLIATEAGERLHVAGSLAAVGEMEQLMSTVPVKPLAGVTVMVDVFPRVAPGATLTAVPLTVKLCGELTVRVSGVVTV